MLQLVKKLLAGLGQFSVKMTEVKEDTGVLKLTNDDVIKKWEALKLKAYLPTPNDVPTIGWGHTHTTKMGQVITVAEAQRLFDKDVAWAVEAVRKHVKVPLNVNQADAIISWTFNIGEANMASSTLVRKLNQGDYNAARKELPRWNKQKGKTLRGLTNRRAEEVKLFFTPVGGK